ncbi:solute carrier family 43 member 3-like [Mizuhopecten yessoensis]|nr:solute carrier family 43 member 3-like [Mizuhopecten yessoensis]
MRTVIPLAVTSCLTILLSALAFISTPTALYVDFVVLTFLRSFVYSIHVQYIRIAFPMKYISMVYGMAVSISGILTMIQYGLFAWTEEYVGAMTHVNVFLLCASCISLFHPILVFFSYRRSRYTYIIKG